MAVEVVSICLTVLSCFTVHAVASERRARFWLDRDVDAIKADAEAARKAALRAVAVAEEANSRVQNVETRVAMRGHG